MTPEEEEILRRRAKAELRKRLRGLRNTTPESAIAKRSAGIVENLRPLLEGAKSVALFWPITSRHEVDLRALDGELRSKGVRVAYPSIDRDTNVMTFRFVDDPSKMEDQGYGFEEPPHDAPIADVDVIVCPALAADPRGHRLGYGAGYYDRTIKDTRALTIAVVLDFQFLPEVPASETDVPVAVVVTDARVVRAQLSSFQASKLSSSEKEPDLDRILDVARARCARAGVHVADEKLLAKIREILFHRKHAWEAAMEGLITHEEAANLLLAHLDTLVEHETGARLYDEAHAKEDEDAMKRALFSSESLKA